MMGIPRIPTSIETMRKICELVKEYNSIEELAKVLNRSKITIKHYLVSMQRLSLIGKNGSGYELLLAGEKFLELSKNMDINEALYVTLTKYGNINDVKRVLEALIKGLKVEKRAHEDFVKNWKVFLRKLGLINKNGELTLKGEEFLGIDRISNIVRELIRKPSLLSRKLAYCPGFEFKDEKILHKSVQHDLELNIVLDELERDGFTRIDIELDYGKPDSILTKNKEIYIHEHKTGNLDKVAFLQALIYAKLYKEKYKKLPEIILTNLTEKIIYKKEDIKDCLRLLDKAISVTAKNLIKHKFRQGYYCSYCGNSKCPFN